MRRNITKTIASIVMLASVTGCETYKISKVNQHVNETYAYIEDERDYVKPLSQFIVDGGGDCEDFANAKYQLLNEKGVADERMRFVLIQEEEQTKRPHLVLRVDNYILDNMKRGLQPAESYKGTDYSHEKLWHIKGDAARFAK